MSSFLKPPSSNSRQRWIIVILLGIVLLGGIASLMFDGKQDAGKQQAEDYQIVDISVPPPPPPPPEEEKMEEPEDIEEPLEPLEMSSTPENTTEESSEVDLGIDIGDLVSSNGSGFSMEIPRFGRGGGGGDGDDSLMGGGMDSPPSPVNKAQPAYPASLLKKGIGGKVLVTCVVDDAGRVISTSIKMSSGQPELDKAAINAVNKWKFKPGMKAGKSIKSTCVVPFNFEVKKA